MYEVIGYHYILSLFINILLTAIKMNLMLLGYQVN